MKMMLVTMGGTNAHSTPKRLCRYCAERSRMKSRQDNSREALTSRNMERISRPGARICDAGV